MSSTGTARPGVDHARGFILVLLVLLTTSCGQVATDRPGAAPGRASAPIYDYPIELVYEAAYNVCSLKFKRVDIEDHAHHHLEATETNWPGGDTKLIVDLSVMPDGKTRVDVSADAGPTASPGWNHQTRDFDNFLTWLNQEAWHLHQKDAAAHGQEPGQPPPPYSPHSAPAQEDDDSPWRKGR